LYDTSDKNTEGNAIIGAKPLLYNTNNCIINLPSGRVAVIQGLDDMIVVEDNGILLICKRNDEQNIRGYVDAVRNEKGEKYV
jgi:mannose-1-phosphate guanylyltransferase